MLIFQFLNDKIYNHVLFDIIVNFTIQKLKKKPFPQKVYILSKAKFSHFDRTRGDKNEIFPTLVIWKQRKKELSALKEKRHKMHQIAKLKRS